VSVRTFPNNLTAMAFGYKPKANFMPENPEAMTEAPKINFK
jgi:LemA protein